MSESEREKILDTLANGKKVLVVAGSFAEFRSLLRELDISPRDSRIEFVNHPEKMHGRHGFAG